MALKNALYEKNVNLCSIYMQMFFQKPVEIDAPRIAQFICDAKL